MNSTRVISPSDSVDLDVLLTHCLVQLSLHPIIGPKECEDQSSQEGEDDGACDENLVLQLRLQSYEEAACAHQRQQHSIQEKLAHGAHLLLRNHDLLGLFALNSRFLKKENQSSVFVFFPGRTVAAGATRGGFCKVCVCGKCPSDLRRSLECFPALLVVD